MRRDFTSQPALFAAPVFEEHPALHAFDTIEEVMDWHALEPLLPQGKGRTGRPGYPALTLLRALMLGQMHGLSDVQLGAQLARDLAFRRFCRLEIDQGTPHPTVPGQFRMALEREGRLEEVLALVNTQLAASGVIIEAGRISIVDATVVEAVRSGRNSPDPEGGNRVKQDARGRKRGTWGYQGFVACDEDQFIHATAMTPGHHGENHELPGLIARAGGCAVYADSAYSSRRNREWMKDKGLVDCIQRKGYRNHPLPPQERTRNAGLAVTRALVEAIFGTLKDVRGLARSRFMGLGRNRCQWQLAAVTWNLAKAARFRARYGVI